MDKPKKRSIVMSDESIYTTYFLYGYEGEIKDKNTGEVSPANFRELYASEEKAKEILEIRCFEEFIDDDGTTKFIRHLSQSEELVITLKIEKYEYREN